MKLSFIIILAGIVITSFIGGIIVYLHTHNSGSKTPDKHPGKTPYKHPDKHPDKTPDNHPDKHPDKTPDNHPDKHPDKTPDKHPDKTPDKHPDKIPEHPKSPRDKPHSKSPRKHDQNNHNLCLPNPYPNRIPDKLWMDLFGFGLGPICHIHDEEKRWDYVNKYLLKSINDDKLKCGMDTTICELTPENNGWHISKIKELAKICRIGDTAEKTRKQLCSKIEAGSTIGSYLDMHVMSTCVAVLGADWGKDWYTNPEWEKGKWEEDKKNCVDFFKDYIKKNCPIKERGWKNEDDAKNCVNGKDKCKKKNCAGCFDRNKCFCPYTCKGKKSYYDCSQRPGLILSKSPPECNP